LFFVFVFILLEDWEMNLHRNGSRIVTLVFQWNSMVVPLSDSGNALYTWFALKYSGLSQLRSVELVSISSS